MAAKFFLPPFYWHDQPILLIFSVNSGWLHSSLPDIDLWNAFTGGDRDAFSVLFRRFYPLLFQYGCKISPDTETVEDAIHELFLELWQKQSTPAVQSVKAYLLQSLKFKLYKGFRGRQHLKALGDEDLPGFELSSETMMIQREEDDEKISKVFAGLQALTPRQREVIYLKIYKGLSYEEVGEVMQLNYQGTRNLLYTALRAFKKLCVLIMGMALIFLPC